LSGGDTLAPALAGRSVLVTGADGFVVRSLVTFAEERAARVVGGCGVVASRFTAPRVGRHEARGLEPVADG
jgi:hypothetical protein